MKLTPTILKLLAGLALVAALAFGKSAFAAQTHGGFTREEPKSGGVSVVAIATIAVGIAGFRRKG